MSACIDGPDVLKEQIPGRNHKSMVKFASRNEKAYEIVSYYIQMAVQAALSGSKSIPNFSFERLSKDAKATND